MGLFDYVRVKYPLQEPAHNAAEYQCKDTNAQYMEHYTIEEDGRLVHHTVEYYDTPEEEKPYPYATDPIKQLCGCISSRPTGDKEEIVHGCLYLTRVGNGPDYMALYQHGKLIEMSIVSEDSG